MVRVRRAAKKGGGGEKRKGVRKKGGGAAPPFFQKGGCTQHRHPPVYATVNSKYILIFSSDDLNKELKNKF